MNAAFDDPAQVKAEREPCFSSSILRFHAVATLQRFIVRSPNLFRKGFPKIAGLYWVRGTHDVTKDDEVDAARLSETRK